MSSPGRAPGEADRLAIDRTRQAHIAAMNQGNPEAFAGVFSEDAVQMPPNAPANVGRRQIQGWAQAFMGAFRAEFALEVAEVVGDGEWAFERGEYRIHLTPRAGGAAMRDAGKYITIYRKQAEGSWLTARDIWNSDRPSPTMP